MTVPVSSFTEHARIPTPHSPWCQPTHCRTYEQCDAIHRHLIGEVAGVQVWVERPDTTRADGSHDYGYTNVHVEADGVWALTAGHLDALRALLTAAEVFADQVEGVR